MDEALRKSGDWPNIALKPGTLEHAATGEHVEQPENTRIGRSRGACRPDNADCDSEPARVENGAQNGLECDTREKLEADVREKNRRQRKQLGELQNAIHERNDGVLKRQWKQQVEELKAEAMRNRDGVESLAEKCQAQREELARFNAEKRGKRRLPKHVAWPRHDDGKLVKLDGSDAKDIVFTRDSCLVRYHDGTDEFFAMDELRRRWKERK